MRYWATELTPVYLEGVLRRTLLDLAEAYRERGASKMAAMPSTVKLIGVDWIA